MLCFAFVNTQTIIIVRYLVSGEDCFDHKIEYFGNGIGQPLQAANPSDCQEKCQKNAECSFWTFLSGESCQLKTSDGGAKRNNLAISGPKTCPSKFKKVQKSQDSKVQLMYEVLH